jgi:hypothetical protein
VVDPTVDRDFSIDKAKQIAKVTGSRVRFFINNPNTLSDHSYIYEGIDGKFFEPSGDSMNNTIINCWSIW